MADWVDRARARKLALIAGEFGVRGGDNCNAEPAVEAMYRVLSVRGIGRFVWHYVGWDGDGLVDAGPGSTGTWTNGSGDAKSTNLTWLVHL